MAADLPEVEGCVKFFPFLQHKQQNKSHIVSGKVGGSHALRNCNPKLQSVSGQLVQCGKTCSRDGGQSAGYDH